MFEMDDSQPEPAVKIEEIKRKNFPFIPLAWIGLLCFIVVDIFAITLFLTTRAPNDFPLESVVQIEPGLSASAVADSLQEQNVVRSSSALYFILVLFHNPSSIKAGAYVFPSTESAFSVASRIVSDTPRADLLSVTFPEGFSVKDYSKIATNSLDTFDAEKFFAVASGSEGYLFPDTYNIPPEYSEEELMQLQKDTFAIKTNELGLSDGAFSLNEYELITLASIVEREANTKESMRMVAGILLNRLEIGMALQADASIEYVLDKSLADLEAEDLKIDSLYNTYLYAGLPPTPIGNPGLDSLRAVLDPLQTDYFYYLTDENGDFYYAETYTQHQNNIEKYLK